MPKVWIPALLLPLSEGKQTMDIPGKTVRQVIDNLELEYPGIGARLMDDDRLRPSISVMVDGVISQEKLRHKLDESSEVHFIPAISGGMGQKR
jgi:molybdopterin synthase sulfur carrier subunit